MEAQNYSVEFDDFTARHYIKSYEKKYKTAWDKTHTDIQEVCRRIDAMLEYSRADLIATAAEFKLVKLDFSVEGTKISPKASGNRCILVVNEDTRAVRVLLVYSKNEIASPNETAKWKAIVKSQYPIIAEIFGM